MAAIPVKLEVFEGPLDLLLNLIAKNKINIYDIPIVLITEQYMEYISAMEQRNMEVMSDFLVMAATLLRIKSKMLLPKDEETEEEEVDPRQELVERLLEYKMYKSMSYELKDRQLDAEKKLYRMPSIPKEIASYKDTVSVEELLADITLQKLHAIFESVLKRQINKIDPIRSQFGKIEKEEVNQEEKMNYLLGYAREKKKFSFKALLSEQKSKMDMIVSFLVILELMKVNILQASQDGTFDDINITYLAENDTDYEWTNYH